MQTRRMIKELQLGIPTPCSENWSRMSPGANGRFCSSCSKTVLDFTAMEDNEILQWFTSHQGSTCGRFRPDQLNRPITIPPQKKGHWRYWHYLIAGLLFSSEVSAQTKPATPPMSQNENRILLGKIKALPDLTPTIDSIHGRVMDDEGQPISFATVIYGNKHVTVTDSVGYFSIPADTLSIHDTLAISLVGYETAYISANKLLAEGQSQAYPIVMMNANRTMGMYEIVNPVRKKKRPVADTIYLFRDTLASIRLALKSLNAYPNPVARGASITLSGRLNQAGTYRMQLFNSMDLLAGSMEVQGGKGVERLTMPIPATLVPGIYIVRLSHPALTQCYTKEIVVF
jgi:hypothetical protein